MAENDLMTMRQLVVLFICSYRLLQPGKMPDMRRQREELVRGDICEGENKKLHQLITVIYSFVIYSLVYCRAHRSSEIGGLWFLCAR